MSELRVVRDTVGDQMDLVLAILAVCRAKLSDETREALLSGLASALKIATVYPSAYLGTLDRVGNDGQSG